VSDEDEAVKSPAEAEPESAAEAGDAGEELGDSPDAIMEALWKRVLEAWDDDKPHQAALTYALQTERLPDIAGRYRKLLDDPDKGPRAKKRIDAIVLAATQLLMATKTPPREKVPWQWTASAAVFFVLVISFLAYKILFRN
jgi:hypothetical protein